MDHLAEAHRALTEPAWRPSPEWLAARGMGIDPLLDAWRASGDARAMLRVVDHLSHAQTRAGMFLSLATGDLDWRYTSGDIFRMRFVLPDGGHVEFEGDDELVDEVRARFPVVMVGDVLAERSRIF